MERQRGFTMVELMVGVMIVAVLVTVFTANVNEARKHSRDVDRQSDLRALQSAVELYKQKNGRYPARCASGQSWSGQVGTQYACSDGSSQYIVGLAPEFMPVLPVDQKLNGTDSGYVYTTNAAGTVYKVEARKTVEAETVTYDHYMKSCDSTGATTGICDSVAPSSARPAWCASTDSTFQTSYALWGGYADSSDATTVEQLTEDIICEIQ